MGAHLRVSFDSSSTTIFVSAEVHLNADLTRPADVNRLKHKTGSSHSIGNINFVHATGRVLDLNLSTKSV